jgi:DNA mismatch repair protein MutS
MIARPFFKETSGSCLLTEAALARPLPDANDAATPLMAQYLAIKARHADCLLFFRLGDFYEMFFEDAQKASRALDIALTRRGQFQGEDVPMCGVPAHAYEAYLARLIKKGFRVAICEQTEDPAVAKKRGAKSIVARDVIRIVTPGTVTEESLLDARHTNYLACLTRLGDAFGLAWLDLGSAAPRCQTLALDALAGALARIDPAELVLPDTLINAPDTAEILAPWRDALTPLPASRFDSVNGRKRLETTYHVADLTAFGLTERAEIAALGALLDYAALTQKNDLGALTPPQRDGLADVVVMDPATRRNLELTRTLSGERKGSLLDAIDRTSTSAGARLLAERLMAPLTDPAAIERRLDAVDFLMRAQPLADTLRTALEHAPDMERALGRLGLNRGGPRDLAALAAALAEAEKIKSSLLAQDPRALPADLRGAERALGDHARLADTLNRALGPELPLLARDGGFIAKGYAPQLDELVTLRDDSRRLIAALQQQYVHASGVTTLKIRHNQVIGYYIEVTPTQADKLLAQKETFIHRQSLASAVRFTTVELAALERKIVEAADKALAVELSLFDDLVGRVLESLIPLRAAAGALAELDVAQSLARLARDENYARPVVDDSRTFVVEQGRHPVVEQALRRAGSGTKFIANTCDLSPAQRLWLITGPNMAGKSTFLRQNALIVLLAQMGSFVPARQAHIGVVDRLFSRVGAADDLARGQSTFMVEMVETATILHQAGPRSLVILDEIGRGTATYDGLSIAWATIEHLHDVNAGRTLFATHYHELTALAGKLEHLHCATMRIREWEKEIIFLHEVADGTADRSYGLHVARMAGLPKNVLTRAEHVLKSLESQDNGSRAHKLGEDLPLFAAQPQPTEPETPPELVEKLRTLNLDEMTPRQALDALYDLKRFVFETDEAVSRFYPQPQSRTKA